MVVLSGKNLGEKQRDLNLKVAEAVANKKNFDEIKMEEEITDTDRLYKIDIASRYEDINYVVEILKSGDSLYISRALKCLWLYSDTYSHVIDTENLHNNIFPFMSINMKKKMLSTISMHVRDMDRAATFFTYCRENKMTGIALKFLNFTSEEFKLNILRSEEERGIINVDSPKLLENFIGSSFPLTIAYFKLARFEIDEMLHNLRFMYSVCNEKYMDLIEEHVTVYSSMNRYTVFERLGIRISKDIMIKHKNRVLKNPLIYVNKLNKSVLVKYSTKEDAEQYLTALMPSSTEDFWCINFMNTYNHVLKVIPFNERFKYVKQLFTSNYPDAPFEMTAEFYNNKFYEMMSIDEREIWALRNIEEQEELLGSGNDYIWYKFVNIEKALVELKKCVMTTPDESIRSDILNTLVEAARDQKGLIKVLNYYYDRHVNESELNKNRFIKEVLNVYNVFEFDNECWEALNKLLYSLEIYTVGRNYGDIYKAVAVAYNILNNKEMPQALVDFIDVDINYYTFSSLLDKLGDDKSEIVFQYLIRYSVEKLKAFEEDPNNEKLRQKLKQYANNIFTLLSCFKKDEKLCPEIVTKFIAMDAPKLENRKKITAEDVFRLLKSDTSLVIDTLTYFEESIVDWPERLNKVLRKLKVYFPNDVAQEYTNFFERWLLKISGNFSNHVFINAAIFGIFQLADERFKISVMEKFQPLKPKIDHEATDRKLLYIQQAICKCMGYSRPPVPLELVLKYIKGDYVQYCLPMFNIYFVNLPLPLVFEFTKATLNAPLSVQKHGLRLAFKCYSSSDLKTLLLNVWKRTKNVSMRMILYKLLFNKIVEANEDTQAILYEALKQFTLDLQNDDHSDLFELISSDRLSHELRGDYLQSSWNMAVKLPEKPININRQCAIINSIESNIGLVQKEFLLKYIIDEHVHDILENKRLCPHEMCEMEELSRAKWELIAKYIVYCHDNEELEERLTLLSYIFKTCSDMWNETYEEKFISRHFYLQFIKSIKDKGIAVHENSGTYNISILQNILDMFMNALPITEIYFTVWDLQLTIYSRISSSLKHLSSADISANFANQIGTFVKELLHKQQFYPSFLPGIAELLKEKFLDVQKILRCYPQFKSLHYALFCESLVNIGIKETHLLTLMFMPTVESVESKMKEHHRTILRKIEAFDDDEVKSFFYSKFVLGDYKINFIDIETTSTCSYRF